jgi:hypothetical protein
VKPSRIAVATNCACRGTSEKTDKLRSTGAGGSSSSSAAEGDRRVEAMVSLLEMGDTLHRGAALLLRVLRMGKDDQNALTKSLAGTYRICIDTCCIVMCILRSMCL